MLSTADEALAAGQQLHLHHHARPGRRPDDRRRSRVDELLAPVVDGGVIVAPGGAEGLADLAAAASRRIADIEALDPGVRRLVSPHTYHVSITDGLFTLKQDLLHGMSRF